MGLYVTQIDMFSKSIGFVFPQDKSVININERILRSTFSIAGNKYYRNNKDGTFSSVDTQLLEPGDRGWAWSANFFDYDNTGIDDCYMTNGWLDGTPAGRQAHQFFIGGHGRLYLWDGAGAQGYASNARGCVAADLAGDGHIDLVVNDFGERPRLLLNQSADRNHWIEIKLHGVRSNRFGIGAEVAVVRVDGTRQWRAGHLRLQLPVPGGYHAALRPGRRRPRRRSRGALARQPAPGRARAHPGGHGVRGDGVGLAPAWGARRAPAPHLPQLEAPGAAPTVRRRARTRHRRRRSPIQAHRLSHARGTAWSLNPRRCCSAYGATPASGPSSARPSMPRSLAATASSCCRPAAARACATRCPPPAPAAWCWSSRR